MERPSISAMISFLNNLKATGAGSPILIESITDCVRIKMMIDTSSRIQEEDKRILEVEFDGVIHNDSDSGFNPALVSGPPVEGAFAWLDGAKDLFTIVITSDRLWARGGLRSIKRWLKRQGWPSDKLGDPEFLNFPLYKLASFAYVGDSVVSFDGKAFPDPEGLTRMKRWTK